MECYDELRSYGGWVQLNDLIPENSRKLKTHHTIQASTDLINWTTVNATLTDNGNGTSSASVNFDGQTVNGQPLIGQSKLFLRVVRN